MGGAVPASDIYALGLAVCRGMTAKDPAALLREGARVQLRAALGVSEAFAAVLARMLDASLERRYADARALEADLARLAGVRVAPARSLRAAPAAPPRARPRLEGPPQLRQRQPKSRDPGAAPAPDPRRRRSGARRAGGGRGAPAQSAGAGDVPARRARAAGAGGRAVAPGRGGAGGDCAASRSCQPRASRRRPGPGCRAPAPAPPHRSRRRRCSRRGPRPCLRNRPSPCRRRPCPPPRRRRRSRPAAAVAEGRLLFDGKPFVEHRGAGPPVLVSQGGDENRGQAAGRLCGGRLHAPRAVARAVRDERAHQPRARQPEHLPRGSHRLGGVHARGRATRLARGVVAHRDAPGAAGRQRCRHPRLGRPLRRGKRAVPGRSCSPGMRSVRGRATT